MFYQTIKSKPWEIWVYLQKVTDHPGNCRRCRLLGTFRDLKSLGMLASQHSESFSFTGWEIQQHFRKNSGIQEQFSSLFHPEEGRRKSGFPAAIPFCGVDQLLPRNILRASQPSSLRVQGWESVPEQSPGTDHAAWFCPLGGHPELCCLAASGGISHKEMPLQAVQVLSPPHCLSLALAPGFLLHGFCEVFPTMLCWLGHFPHSKYCKPLLWHYLALWDLSVGFLQEGVVEGFLSLGFPKTSWSSNAAGATFSVREKLLVFRAVAGAFWAALITPIKGFSVSFVWCFLCQPL